ncbi:Hypothetical predicted protein [Cloeon dipterum]|uniref:Caspase family p20 domain-containing protein n=1 Tax=Cloeon dipterum TaxID=197152 RepID=A0A8S1E0M5_9INSE|nr:Hypothetical predicted protein [Cloeon dipterum]
MKKPAKLGFFQSFQDGKFVTQRAESVWVLAVHYDFKFNEEKHPASSKKFFNEHFRNGDDVDVGNLRKTFEERRNCNFYDFLSPTKEKLLELLADKDQLLQLFECKDLPDVFVLFFLSHGNENGVIYSDHCDKDGLIVSFTTDEIFQSLESLTGLEKCLKLVNFGPCRGLLDDAKYDSENEYENYDNRNSCRITFEPAMHNLVVFYSTVETTEAVRAKTGSWFVWNICSYLNLMREDEPLIIALTSIQWRIHNESQSCRMGNKLFLGQTPEVKILSQDSLFFFYKNEKPVVCQPSPKDALRRLPVKKIRRDELYSWQSDKSQNLRGRRAFILSTPTADDITNRLVDTLRQNLQFETSARKLSMSAIKLYFHDVLKLEPDVGCVLTCVFSQKIASFGHFARIYGPKIDKWIGKPKLFFLVDVEQQAFQTENISLKRCEYKISATNHSGWLVVILRDKKQFERLLKILDGDELKRGKSLQELLTPLLLISSTKKSNILLNSTLQYLLDFPVWPRIFVKPDFKFKLDENSSEQNFSFDQLLQEAKITLKESRVWILSSVAGAGKTTILKEIAFELKQAEFHVLNVIMLQKHRLYFETCFKMKLTVGLRAKELSFSSMDSMKFALITEKKKSEEECSHFLRNFKGGNILENPLHLSLLAECEGEDNLYRIYEKVVKRKTKQCLEMQNEGNTVAEWRIEKTLKLHRLIASRFISGGCLIGQGVNKEDLEKLNGFGIATYINGMA